MGGFGHSNSKANVAITARVINIDTGEIMAVADGTGQSGRSSTSMLGGGGNWHGLGGGNADFGSSDFQQTIIGEATKTAVDQLSANLVAEAGKVGVRTVVVEGLVAAVDGGQIILNVGGNAGVKVGDQLQVVRVTKEIKDPTTGNVLRRLTTTVGIVKATDVDAVSRDLHACIRARTSRPATASRPSRNNDPSSIAPAVPKDGGRFCVWHHR